TPSLVSVRVLILGVIAAFLASRCPSTATQSNSYNYLKIVAEYYRHLHYHRSSFDLLTNYKRF
ncbi:hypothetical protein B296_00007559, partial [Ensete ventricosum]